MNWFQSGTLQTRVATVHNYCSNQLDYSKYQVTEQVSKVQLCQPCNNIVHALQSPEEGPLQIWKLVNAGWMAIWKINCLYQTYVREEVQAANNCNNDNTVVVMDVTRSQRLICYKKWTPNEVFQRPTNAVGLKSIAHIWFEVGRHQKCWWSGKQCRVLWYRAVKRNYSLGY